MTADRPVPTPAAPPNHRSYLDPAARARYDNGALWPDVVAKAARPGQARSLTVAILRLYPELGLGDVVGVIPQACSAGLRRRTPGACQTIDAGLGTIDVRGPGWVDHGYPVDVVVPELAQAGFAPSLIVALFNGHVGMPRLAPIVQAACPDYVPNAVDEAGGPALAQRWRCALACCLSRRARLLARLARPASTSALRPMLEHRVGPV